MSLLLEVPMVVYVALMILLAIVFGRLATVLADRFRRPEHRSAVLPHGPRTRLRLSSR
ncbi:MAG: hypothetical protein RL180_466 [Pseudomonadota bacterium]|jgi:hypothetical protein